MESPSYASLSPLQLGMVSDHARHFDPGLDVLQILCEAREHLDPEAFEQAWNVVVNRHDLLRSRFLWEEVDEPVREMPSGVRVPLARHDWRSLPGREQQARFEAFLQEDRRLGVALTVAPVLRVTLFHLGRKKWRWCITFHHLIMDARTMLLVLEEVFFRLREPDFRSSAFASSSAILP